LQLAINYHNLTYLFSLDKQFTYYDNIGELKKAATSISFLIPVFNEQESIFELYEKLKKQLLNYFSDIKKEIVFVNDGSTDNSLKIIKEIINKDDSVKVVSFRRRFGKGIALNHGFNKCIGQYIVTLDGDLQDDPKNIPHLVKKLEEGYDLAVGWKKDRRDKITKVIPSKFFNLLVTVVGGFRLHDSNSGFKAFRKKAVEGLDASGGRYRFLPMILHKKGYKVCEIPIIHHPRKYGKSKYAFSRFMTAPIDLLVVLLETKFYANRKPIYLSQADIVSEN
jgi:glycosyltransferase involved in cell wall biosynthesis